MKPEEDANAQGSSVQPADTISRRGRFWFRIFAVLIPFLLLLAMEAILRQAGVGYPTAFFLKKKAQAKTVLIDNPRFGWRFFPREAARTPHPLSILPEKPPGSVRIFVLGESAAMGDPEPSYGFARQLERILQARHPEQRVEVINVAMTAINSHAILEIAKDCAPLGGDFWLVFAGNNEVVGPFGAGTVFGRQAPTLRAVRFNLALKRTRIGQSLAKLADRSSGPRNWQGMELFLEHRVAPGDPRLKNVYRSFQADLEDIADIGSRNRARVLLATMPVNLKDSPPFASSHRGGLKPAELEQWEQTFTRGRAAQADGRYLEALSAFQEAAAIDAEYAELAFDRGQTELSMGQAALAEADFRRARDLDVLRFRADSQINRIVREVATKRQHRAALIDVETEIGKLCQGTPGEEMFYDHVHLNFTGNYRVAMLFAQAMEKVWPGNGSSSKNWLSEEELAQRLVFTAFDAHRIGEEMRARLQQPPFSGQGNFQERDRRWREKLASFHPDTNALVLSYNNAVKLSTNDWILRANFARLLEFAADPKMAMRQWVEVAQLLPHSPEPWLNLGRLAHILRDDAKAEEYLSQGLAQSPDSVEIMTELGLLLADEGALPQAVSRYRAALRRQPGYSPARINLGVLLARQGNNAQARAEYLETLKWDNGNVDARLNLANLLSREGNTAEALALYDEAVRLQPENALVHYNLGRLLIANNRNTEAVAHFQSAVQFGPEWAEAHYELGHALARAGNGSAALTQFAEAVRLKPDFGDARFNFGVALAKAGRYAEAVNEFRETLRLRPDYPSARQMLENATRANNQTNGR